MDAWFQKLASNMLFTTSKSAPAEEAPAAKQQQQQQQHEAPSSPRSHPARTHIKAPSQPLSAEPVGLPRRRIAHWDKKREKCANCQHIYLKTLSQHTGFCSVDCKSNMVYLEKVNRTIRAMKDAVQEQQRQREGEDQQQQQAEQPVQEQTAAAKQPQQLEEEDAESTEVAGSMVEARTFSEFGLETRILEASNVEWSFSAIY